MGVIRSYNGNGARVLDLVRSTIVADRISEVRQVLEMVSSEASVHLIKNRFDSNADAKDTFGYRDVNVQLSFEQLEHTSWAGFVFELQIQLKSILNIKSAEGHRAYIRCRNLSGC